MFLAFMLTAPDLRQPPIQRSGCFKSYSQVSNLKGCKLVTQFGSEAGWRVGGQALKT